MKIKIQHGIILSLDEYGTIFYDGVLCTDRNKIIYVGETEPEGFCADKVINAKGCLVMPALVNAHCHSPMTMFRNYAGGLPLQTWMYEKIRPLQQYVTKKEIEACAKLAYIEMIKSGTAAFAEMYAWADLLGELAAESGLKALIAGCYGNDNGLSGDIDKEKVLEHRQELLVRSNGRVKEGVLIHALYSVPEVQIRKRAEFAVEANLPLQIHVSETRQELGQAFETYHMTPVQKLEELGVFDTQVIAAHCVYLEKKDIEILCRHGVHVAHCPVSNMKLGSGFADIPTLVAGGVNVCLGTDGAASNNNLNLWKEANAASLLAKGIYRDSSVLSAETMVRMATQNGYRALGIENSGMLKNGMNADLIVVSMKEPHFTPLVDPFDALIYAAQASDVVHTMIDGMIVMENREIKTLDEERILAEAREASHRILEFGM